MQIIFQKLGQKLIKQVKARLNVWNVLYFSRSLSSDFISFTERDKVLVLVRVAFSKSSFTFSAYLFEI